MGFSDNMTGIVLERRSQMVLSAVVEQYVASGEPVGSRSIARNGHSSVSAATIRNTMADLEEMGLLEQPHTSAGRVPTELGYRVYVDNLMREKPIGPAEEVLIQRALEPAGSETADLFARASRVLSRLSNQIGVVVTPYVSRVHLRHIEFVRLAPRRLVAVIVADTGLIHNKVFDSEEDYSQDQLDRAGRFLTETFAGNTLPETRERIIKMIAEEKALYDRLTKDALTLARAAVAAAVVEGEAPGDSSSVFVDGTANLLGAPDFTDAERLKAIFRTFEEKHHIVRILNRCLEEGGEGVRIMIGSETHVPDLTNCTLIASAYGPAGSPLGALGVIGPTRMEYARAVALVDYVSRFFGTMLSRYST